MVTLDEIKYKKTRESKGIIGFLLRILPNVTTGQIVLSIF